MRVLVVGSGPAGRRHLGNALELGHEAALARRAGQDVAELSRELGVEVFSGLAEAERFQAESVVVADAPASHLASAGWAVERGLPVLVEKPLAPGAAGVSDLFEAARARGVRLAVGHNLRFHPALRALEAAVAAGRLGRLLTARLEVGSHLPAWHPGEDYRRTTPAARALGGGALLTLVHELDVALWIGGRAELAAGVRGRVSGLEIDADDVAELVLRHASGALSSVHMDLVDRSYNRRSRWVGDAGTLSWEWGGPVSLAAAGEAATLWDDPSFDLGATYVEELAAFLNGEPAPGDALADALLGLELCDQVAAA